MLRRVRRLVCGRVWWLLLMGSMLCRRLMLRMVWLCVRCLIVRLKGLGRLVLSLVLRLSRLSLVRLSRFVLMVRRLWCLLV